MVEKRINGMAPEHFRRASGKIIRTILQQLEIAKLIKQETIGVHKGRVITNEGKSLLFTTSKEFTPSKAKPAVKKEVPKVEAPKKEVPKVEAPKKEVPKVETSVVEKKVEVKTKDQSFDHSTKLNKPEVPKVEVPKKEVPKAEAKPIILEKKEAPVVEKKEGVKAPVEKVE